MTSNLSFVFESEIYKSQSLTENSFVEMPYSLRPRKNNTKSHKQQEPLNGNLFPPPIANSESYKPQKAKFKTPPRKQKQNKGLVSFSKHKRLLSNNPLHTPNSNNKKKKNN